MSSRLSVWRPASAEPHGPPGRPPAPKKTNSGFATDRHADSCVFSFKGISDMIKAKRGPIDCPWTGCSRKITKADLVEAKGMMKHIREMEEEDEE